MQQKVESGVGSMNLDCLAKELHDKSAKEVFAELESKLFEAERTGTEIDPDVLDIYLCILDQKDPIPDDGVSFDQMWGRFKNHHPELITPTSNEPKRSWRPKSLPFRRRVALTMFALLALLVGATVALHMGNLVHDKGETTISERPSGTMLMEVDDTVGYRSLAEALKDYSISDIGTLLTWIPEEYALASVSAIEVEGTTKITAVFRAADGKEIAYRLIHDLSGASSIEYEKNTAYQDTWTFDGYNYYFMVNNDDLRVMWDIGSTYISIFGDATEEQLKEMVKSIKTR